MLKKLLYDSDEEAEQNYQEMIRKDQLEKEKGRSVKGFPDL